MSEDVHQDLPAAAASPQPCEDEMYRALRNCRMLAAREINRHNTGKSSKIITLAAWKHILRFCEEAGVVGSILRISEQGGPDGTPPQAEKKP